MIDREKVIAGLTMLADRINDDTCEGLKCCKIAEDALALLKEQEAKIEQLNRFVNGFSRDAIPVVRCKDCKHGSIDQSGLKGVWCPAHAEWHENDWFCADGVKKDD